MERQKVLEVEVDFCPRCRGLWLDHGEIKQLASDKAVALRQAMLETQARHPDPLAWAGFFLVGDNE